MMKRKGKKDDSEDCEPDPLSETPKSSGLKAKLLQRKARQEAAAKENNNEEQDEY